MQDFVFYNVGCTEPRGLRRVLVPLRRLLRRVLRPIFQRLVELLQHLAREQDRLAERQEQTDKQVQALLHLEQTGKQVQALLHLGWDYVAVLGRLAELENQLAALTPPRPEAAPEQTLPFAPLWEAGERVRQTA